ncbi:MULTISPECIES: aminodeoxychorismate/anthranilate synthase component II [unclassified Psychrobacter]|uniref:anthranilate synthase component II n=1 Tax=unclassified Psychrobacter TaxID=196806 RepID=UPI000354ADBF|nr:MULTISPECIES: aminodeoxychorismate/anthranilate synthase component II [unclassified Psychrobacter]AGP49575.1 anthranilate synthase subunit II [Psychrobacter sp. G]KAA0938433.1 aminodeoxychorismate/anthranilate synthase component II [Psychrobacter sp. ANT_H59]WAI87152.1 Aminodeoxychorismate synthase component 2 [Psychrobacter sp. SC65A.3]|tara:strand:- start:1306 stop:1953 length:648 start_codon:yes stop_codon:yes gene_type:complete
MNVLIIDNYDSFTFNLYQYIGEILQTMDSDKQANVIVKRNNEITLADVQAMSLDRIIISPGPGSPDDPAYFGICAEVIEVMGKTTPLLGVCLGMQGIAHVFGGDVIRASVPMHGKVSAIRHDSAGIYNDLPQELEIMRYHSLMVQADTLPNCLTVTAVVANDEHNDLDLTESALAGDEIMGVQHKDYPIQGVQFHPESFATEGAKRLLTNFLLQV